jgi:transcriptional regulator with GAF, ATPase, and Fis domain
MNDTARVVSRQADPAPRAALRLVHPPALARTIALREHRVTLGSHPEHHGAQGAPAILQVGVARSHLAIEWDRASGRHVGVDLGSSTGSAVDGVPAAIRRPLEDGSVLRLGPVLLVYERWDDDWSSAERTPVSPEAVPGDSPAARRLRLDVAQVASDPSPVLVIGATGTGKESIASEIHRLSGRRGKLVAVNCAALSPQLIDSQLFGHVKGAFTGAHDDQPGLFRAAQGGTLMLDEIGELPLELQPKLLRVLQERVVLPVGAARPVPIDVRVVAATNRDLSAVVDGGGFRRDLYARLSLWEIRVPALRHRRGDLFLWIERLHRRFCLERGLPSAPAPAFDPAAAERLLLGEWPENLRGIDRLVHALGRRILAGETITTAALPAWLRTEASVSAPAAAGHPPPPARSRPPVPGADELRAILAERQGSVRATARHFGRDRRQIYRWIQAFGLRDPK